MKSVEVAYWTLISVKFHLNCEPNADLRGEKHMFSTWRQPPETVRPHHVLPTLMMDGSGKSVSMTGPTTPQVVDDAPGVHMESRVM